ncbi:MAG: 4Fe-4S dicluster domain-containing protein [Spirochaetes bacterium]|nr:4Fe-4S dicluster domain-containing protein [Spirochaetota bacterium]
MKFYRALKKFRVLFALLTIVLISSIFLDIYSFIPAVTAKYIAVTQFIPSYLSFIHTPSPVYLLFILIILITVFSGRIYCSFLCPLGIYQDIISRISSILNTKKKYGYSAENKVLRYLILCLTLLSFPFVGTILILWLDPFSLYGKFLSSIVTPGLLWINNIIASLLMKFNIYSMYSIDIKYANIIVIITAALIIFLISLTAFLKGRLYCNSICPAGTLLGLISKVSFLKITISNDGCIHCRLCESICKSSCIKHKDNYVDFSRCVSCFNCVQVCPNSSIKFRKQYFTTKAESNRENQSAAYNKAGKIERKSFITGLLFIPSILFGQKSDKEQILYVQDISKQKQYKKKIFTSPPGSISIDDFNKNCTACYLCVTRCPSSVLQPAVLQYGLSGIMQPFLDFNTGYCNYDCTICSEVCPTGAIKRLDKSEKHLIQLGKSYFVKENCITYTNGTACGACSEHCPTKAVDMVPFKKGLVIPEINQAICIGCGACENVCPVRPLRAIYVEGNRVHEKAELPKEEDVIIKKDDFPF